MLVPVKFGEAQKYVNIDKTKEGWNDFGTFLQKGECVCHKIQIQDTRLAFVDF